MIWVRCPNDLTLVEMFEPVAVCPTCNSVLTVPVIVMRLGCDHQPRPVRGMVNVAGENVPYEFCSAECKTEQMATYPPDIVEVS